MAIEMSCAPLERDKSETGILGLRLAIAMWFAGVAGYIFLIFQRVTGLPENLFEYAAHPGRTLGLIADGIGQWAQGFALNSKFVVGTSAYDHLLIAATMLMAIAMTGVVIAGLQIVIRWFFFEAGFLALSFVAGNIAAGADAAELALAVSLLALTAFIVVKVHTGSAGPLRKQRQT